MSIQIKLSGALAGQSSSIVCNAPEGTLTNLLSFLKEENPKLYDRIVDSNERIRSFVGIYINGNPVNKNLDDIKIGTNDEVLIIGSVAGG